MMEEREWVDLLLEKAKELRLVGVEEFRVDNVVVKLRPPDAMPGQIEVEEEPEPRRYRRYSEEM